MGKAEWFIIPKGVDLFHTGNQDVQAVIYKVRNKNKFPDCFDFLASLMKERRLTIEELGNIKHLPPQMAVSHPSKRVYRCMAQTC